MQCSKVLLSNRRPGKLVAGIAPPARSVAARLNTRQRRLFGASQAQQLGHGGITRIAEITGLDWKTIRKGIKEQIVIPETIRKRLNLKEGAQFVVVGEGDVVILKVITAPSLEAFDALIQQARQQAKVAGLERADIAKAVSKARERK